MRQTARARGRVDAPGYAATGGGDATSIGRAMKEPVRVLFVCSANLCRSVTAAEYARRMAVERPSRWVDWYIESAGTDVSPGQGLPRDVALRMDELDIPRRAEPLMLTEEYARSADLILTAERHHRAVVAGRYPFAVRRTFTLLEFARLIAAGRSAVPRPVVRGADDLLELARIGRSHVQPVDDSSIDIGDPVAARSASAMTICSDTIGTAIETIFGE